MVARKVCWRTGMLRAPPINTSRRCERRVSSACGESSRVRVAASSIARGSPSRRTQTSAMVRALASVTWKSGLMACARCTKRGQAGGGITEGWRGDEGEGVCKGGREGVGGGEREAGFAAPAWTGEGEQAHLGATQQGRELGEFLRAAKQRGEWIWQGVEWFLTCARCNSGWECNDGVL